MLEMIKGRGVDYVKKCMCHFVRLIVVILEMRGEATVEHKYSKAIVVEVKT